MAVVTLSHSTALITQEGRGETMDLAPSFQTLGKQSDAVLTGPLMSQ